VRHTNPRSLRLSICCSHFRPTRHCPNRSLSTILRPISYSTLFSTCRAPRSTPSTSSSSVAQSSMAGILGLPSATGCGLPAAESPLHDPIRHRIRPPVTRSAFPNPGCCRSRSRRAGHYSSRTCSAPALPLVILEPTLQELVVAVPVGELGEL
jgi:hypothetical protein